MLRGHRTQKSNLREVSYIIRKKYQDGGILNLVLYQKMGK